MRIVAEQHPIELLLEVPLRELTEFAAHEQQLLAGVRHHVAEERTHSCEFFFVIARHFVYQRALAVNHLVMRNRQNEILGKRIEKRECQAVVIIFSEKPVK